MHERLHELSLKEQERHQQGATAISVPALITDQSTPDSGAPKMARPTVSGRVFTELVTTSGHRKLFQW